MGLFRHCCGSESDCRPTSRAGRALHFAGHAVLGLAVVVAVALLFGWVVMTAWNAVIPATFSLPPLAFWPAVALLVLGRVLTGRFHHRHGGRRHGLRTMSRYLAHGKDGDPFGHAEFGPWWDEEGEAAFRSFRTRRPAGTAE